MSNHVLLEVTGLSCATDKGLPILSNTDLRVNEGDIVVLQGKSGSGKTTFLKSLAHLNFYTGQILFRGRTPKSYGVPFYRTKVAYVPQRPPLLPGTPRDFLTTALSFKARKTKHGTKTTAEDVQNPLDVASSWGIEFNLWDREWSNLSGGETQRIALAIGVGLNAEVLLLDEPTSALDHESCLLVEQYLLDDLRSAESSLKAIVWITHSPEQAGRVGTRQLQFSGGKCFEDSVPPV